MSSSTQLFGRYLSVIVAPAAGGEGIELVAPTLNALHIEFDVRHIVISTPHTARIKIWNVSTQTAQFIANIAGAQGSTGSTGFGQWQGQVIIKAGYTGNYGTIFTGSIRQVRSGREQNVVDTFVEILAADSDTARNWGLVNVSLAAGHSQADIQDIVAQQMSKFGTVNGTKVTWTDDTKACPVKPPDSAARGRALYGPAKAILNDLADSHNNTWSLDNNTLNFLPRTAYKPGDAVVLTPSTGLIGLPRLTADGINVRCLLNPAIGPGAQIQLDTSYIQQPPIGLEVTNLNILPPTNDMWASGRKGYYKVLWVDHIGDNRGTNWYSDMICLSIDKSAQLPNSVKDVASGIPP
jgi:hypothetical protein